MPTLIENNLDHRISLPVTIYDETIPHFPHFLEHATVLEVSGALPYEIGMKHIFLVLIKYPHV